MSLAVQSQYFSASVQESLSDLSQSLLQELGAYAQLAFKLGYLKQQYSQKALQQLELLPDQKKQEIIHFLKLCTECGELSTYQSEPNQEKFFLQRALSHYGLKADQRLLDTIDHETVIEVYSEDMVQLYRSFKMLDMTGYSLLDLSVFEWYVLWERPQLVIQQMQNEIKDVLSSGYAFKIFEVTPHILRETFNTGMTEPFIPKNAFVQFQHIGLLERENLQAPRAFICTAKGTIIAEGVKETARISFL